MISDRDDAYRREYEALRNSRRALEAGHGPLTLAATVVVVVAAVLLGAWWLA